MGREDGYLGHTAFCTGFDIAYIAYGVSAAWH